MKAQSNKLESDKLWREGTEIFDFMEQLIPELPAEEKDMIEFKLHRNGFHLTSSLAEAGGSKDWRDKLFQLQKARKELFGIKNAYLMASKLQYISISPEIMVKIDKLVSDIDKEIDNIDKPENWLKAEEIIKT